MEAKDLTSNIIAAGALLVSVIVAFRSRMRDKTIDAIAEQSAKHADDIAKHNEEMKTIASKMQGFASAESELSILAHIESARGKINDILNDIINIRKGRLDGDLKADDKRYLEGKLKIYASAVESHLNFYELGCMMYRDGRLDKESFRKQYFDDLRDLFAGSEEYTKRLLPFNSKYRAMREVHKEWYNLEIKS